jgi:hypothetical protein
MTGLGEVRYPATPTAHHRNRPTARTETVSVTILQWIGLFLVAAGVVEFVLFRILAPHRANIARRIVLLNANAALNVVVGVVLLIAGG